ncbi:hypothetical protein RJ639_034326 [Escallonia herrerae]|uniref:WD repeat-containing protein 55 n=1 Tax=Escallonia herrerae TaxID=1293975 RepID=A0AA89BJS8_9ASTE|nr:hypothetical protein RJ639_034326 [Escallonia herrerae]
MEINLGKHPFDIDFHPSNQIVAAGLITGDLLLEFTFVNELQKLHFLAILTGSPDLSILATDVETGSAIARLENAHGAAVNRLVNLTATTIASGDDDGCIKVLEAIICINSRTFKAIKSHSFFCCYLFALLMIISYRNYKVWDTRQRSCCNTFEVHEEYVSDITFASDSMKLLATSGDGTLSVCNLRSNKVQTRSEFSEDELLSVVIMKNGRKVICGTQAGTLLLYSWGCFKDCSDRFVDLSPNSVDALLKLDEERLITGSENGLISLVGILPNRIIQPIAEHSDYPVERLAFSHDRKILGSISHDWTLKVRGFLPTCVLLWDLDDLLQDSGNTTKTWAVQDSDSDEMDMDLTLPKPSKGTKRKNGEGALSSSNGFFADL